MRAVLAALVGPVARWAAFIGVVYGAPKALPLSLTPHDRLQRATRLALGLSLPKEH